MTIPQSTHVQDAPQPSTPTGEQRGSNFRTRKTPNQIETRCDNCGAALYYFPSQLRQGVKHFCDKVCHGEWRSKQTDAGAAHWKGGERVERGRVYWHLPWHHDADEKGYVERARIVAELTLGRPLLPGEVVHHKDEDRSNDHPGNLEVYASQADHARHHGLQRTAEQMAAMRAAKRSA